MKDLKGQLISIGLTAAGVAVGMVAYAMWDKAAKKRAADALLASATTPFVGAKKRR